MEKRTLDLLNKSENTYIVVTPSGAALSGNDTEILSMLGSLLKSMREDYSEEQLKRVFDLSAKSEKELEKMALEFVQDMLNKLKGIED